jgi:hypothetical protein
MNAMAPSLPLDCASMLADLGASVTKTKSAATATIRWPLPRISMARAATSDDSVAAAKLNRDTTVRLLTEKRNARRGTSQPTATQVD